MIALNGSGFDSYDVSYNLPQGRTVTNLNTDGAVIISPKIFNRYVDKDKTIPQDVLFLCGRVHNDN